LENKMIERTCKLPHEYGGRQIEVGQRFTLEPADVALAVALGRIEREDSDPVPGFVPRDMAANWPNTYSTRAMTAGQARKTRGARAN
jgi:hypothetical protein